MLEKKLLSNFKIKNKFKEDYPSNFKISKFKKLIKNRIRLSSLEDDLDERINNSFKFIFLFLAIYMNLY